MNDERTDMNGAGSVPEVPYTDNGLLQVDALLARAGAVDRAAATADRVNRVAAESGLQLVATPVETGVVAHIGDARFERRRGLRMLTGMRLAAGFALIVAVGASLIASRHTSHTTAAESTLALDVDATTDLAAVDALFADAVLSDTWTDAEALHTRVSADIESYWSSDDLFETGEGQRGESL